VVETTKVVPSKRPSATTKCQDESKWYRRATAFEGRDEWDRNTWRRKYACTGRTEGAGRTDVVTEATEDKLREDLKQVHAGPGKPQ